MKSWQFWVLVLFAVILLGAAGCSRNYAQYDHQVCESYGIYWGTPEYAQCRTAQEQMRRQDYANRVRAYGVIMGTQQRQTNCYTTGQTTQCW